VFGADSAGVDDAAGLRTRGRLVDSDIRAQGSGKGSGVTRLTAAASHGQRIDGLLVDD